jgi:hypothetical protein
VDARIIGPRRGGNVSGHSPSRSRAVAIKAGRAGIEVVRQGLEGRTSTSASGPQRLKNRHPRLGNRDTRLQKPDNSPEIDGVRLELRAGRVEIGWARVEHFLAILENDAANRVNHATFPAFW